MSKVKGIVELLVAALLVALIVWTVIIPDEGRTIEDATYVEGAQVLPENEGQRVIVAGEVIPVERATDPDLNITFETPFARRVVERLDYNDDWVWEEQSDASTTASFKSATFATPLQLGEFELDAELASRLPISERDWTIDDLDEATREQLEADWYFVDDGSQLYLAQIPTFTLGSDPRVETDALGSFRARYRLWDAAANREVTVVGIQRGSTLCYDPDLNASSTYAGVLGADEVVSQSSSDTAMGVIVFAAIPAVLLAFFGIRNMRG